MTMRVPFYRMGHTYSYNFKKETGELMTFFERHQEYINACATARAWEIAYSTKRYDIDDYKQEMFLYLLKHIEKYNPDRSGPHTFINLLMASSHKIILRSQNRNKNRIITEARTFDYA